MASAMQDDDFYGSADTDARDTKASRLHRAIAGECYVTAASRQTPMILSKPGEYLSVSKVSKTIRVPGGSEGGCPR